MTDPAMLAMLRRDQAASFPSQVEVKTVTWAFDAEEGVEVEETVAVHYDGGAQVLPLEMNEVTVVSADGEVGVGRYRVVIGADVDVPRKAVVDVISSDRDEGLAGVRLVVDQVQVSDHQVNRVLICERDT